MKSITECTKGHCAFHFPQFKTVSLEKIHENIAWIEKENEEKGAAYLGFDPSKNIEAYRRIGRELKAIVFSNDEEQYKANKKKLIELVEEFGKLWGWELYLDKHEWPAIFQQCCR